MRYDRWMRDTTDDAIAVRTQQLEQFLASSIPTSHAMRFAVARCST
jgi:hypothetical protein